MSDESAFIGALQDHPEDDALRLVYADWLEERGDPRGEYLRLLVAFDHAATDTTAAELLARFQRIQCHHGFDRQWILLMNRGRLERLLRSFLGGSPRQDWPDRDEHRELARRWDALPVYSDLGGTILLRRDGELLCLSDDEVTPWVVTQRSWRLIGLTSGVVFFPALLPLLPPRPDSAVDCHGCGGRGVDRWTIDGRKGVTPCGTCWGLGWFPQRPSLVADCAACRGTGKQAREHAGSAYDASCHACAGWGWATGQPTDV